MVFEIESASFENGEVLFMFDVDWNLISVHHVGADTREMLDNRDIKSPKLISVADSAELEQLRGVERAARDDDFLLGSSGTEFAIFRSV